MSAFFNSVFTSVSSAASALLTPEFWAVSILVFRICYRSFILKLTTHLKERYHYDYIDSFAKAFNHPIQAFLWILAFYSFIVLSPLSPFSQHPAFDKILRSSLIICLIGGVYNLCDAGHGPLWHICCASCWALSW